MSEFKQESVKEVPKSVGTAKDTVFVTIPDTDIFDSTHPGVRLIGGTIKEWKNDRWVETNQAGTNIKFEAGKTYEVPTTVGVEVERILKNFHRESVRLLRPKTDNKSINQVNAGSNWGGMRAQTFSMDSDAALSKLVEPGEKVITTKW